MRPGIQRVGIRPSASAGGLTSSDKPLTIMIGSSGDAETKAAQDAVAAWSAKSGVSASVVAATDLAQQLSQGFASRLSAGPLLPQHRPARGLREQRLTKAYGDQLSNKGDFYPSLVKNFTYDNTFFCAPKDFSTLQLVINENLWTKGLTDADIPTTWDQLAAVAAKLTSGTTKACLRRRVRPSRRLHGAGRRPPRLGGRKDRRSQQRRQRDGARLRAEAPAGRHLRLRLRCRGGLGRRGVRQAAGRHDDRGQLDHRRPRRLPPM
jgi:hypothetical protein